jgi:pyridoxamine 5'-phosphate oxidase
MIMFLNDNSSIPFLEFKNKYNQAIKAKQSSVEAVCISSFNNTSSEVNSRYVNLKVIDNDKFIFFSNYNSPKSIEFSSYNQIAAVFFWESTNSQIRIKAKIKKTSYEYNQRYFLNRSEEKNALAISSNQSNSISSYNQVRANYNKSLKNDDLKKCPEFWGGYSFTPYYFEFWEGHESRLNKREVYEKSADSWKYIILQP